MTIVHCPTCGTPVEWTEAARYRPFCSRRCRLIDLGEWLDERHRIPGEPADEETIETESRDEDQPG